jgi:ABC-type transporter Mla MlaB component
MSDSSPDCADACEKCDLGPLTLAAARDRWRFTLTNPNEMTLELPPDYEQFLRKRLEPFLKSRAEPAIEMDLEDLPAISSRHLGLMLSLRKALADRCEHLQVRGISPGVRRLLKLTRTSQFFDIA